MTTVADMVPRVREALGVNSSYDAATIPDGIRGVMRKLLRDYNFPKSIVRLEYPALTVGVQSFDAPAGLKRPLQVQFYDPAESQWSEPLRRRDGFTLPTVSTTRLGVSRYYWLEGTKLWIDSPIDTGTAGFTLQFFYQSQLVDDTAEVWMLDDFADVIFTYSVVRLAPEVRKPEVMQAFGPLQEIDQQSLAIYVNELEFAGLDMQWREPRDTQFEERYPR